MYSCKAKIVLVLLVCLLILQAGQTALDFYTMARTENMLRRVDVLFADGYVPFIPTCLGSSREYANFTEIDAPLTPLYREMLLDVGKDRGVVEGRDDSKTLLAPYRTWRARQYDDYWEAEHPSIRGRHDISWEAVQRLIRHRHGGPISELDTVKHYKDRRLDEFVLGLCPTMRKFVVADGEFSHGSYLVQDK